MIELYRDAMKVKSLELKVKSYPPSEIITPPTPSYLKRGCRRQGRYFKGGMGGFTLIELVMTMVLIGIIAYIVATALTTGIKAYFTTDFRKEALDQSRIAMERMTREIRNVRSLGKDTDIPPDGYINADITTATATSFCFTDVNGTTISFELSGTNILRGEGSCPPVSTNTLAANVTALNFQYILADSTVTQAPAAAELADIRRIQIGWSGTPGISVAINNETVSLSSEVYLRNLQ